MTKKSRTRIKYAAKQLREYSQSDKNRLTQKEINIIPAWNAEEGIIIDDLGWIDRLEKHEVFFSSPLDLDFMMMTSYPDAYHVDDDNLEEPAEGTIKAVLGKKHDVLDDQYTEYEQTYFDAYHRMFQLGSKPTWHIRAMASVDDEGLIDDMPEVLDRMFDRIESKLKDLPE